MDWPEGVKANGSCGEHDAAKDVALLVLSLSMSGMLGPKPALKGGVGGTALREMPDRRDGGGGKGGVPGGRRPGLEPCSWHSAGAKPVCECSGCGGDVAGGMN